VQRLRLRRRLNATFEARCPARSNLEGQIGKKPFFALLLPTQGGIAFHSPISRAIVGASAISRRIGQRGLRSEENKLNNTGLLAGWPTDV